MVNLCRHAARSTAGEISNKKEKEEKRKRVSNGVAARRNTRGDARAAMSVTLLCVEKEKKAGGTPGRSVEVAAGT